jgi:hypothetical protein
MPNDLDNFVVTSSLGNTFKLKISEQIFTTKQPWNSVDAVKNWINSK